MGGCPVESVLQEFEPPIAIDSNFFRIFRTSDAPHLGQQFVLARQQ